MEFNVREGMASTREIYVTENDVASKLGSGNIDVFSTPSMIALMENTSKSCVDLHLPFGYTTVGIEVNVKHIKASPIGMKIRCEASLVKVDKKKLVFNVEAWDEKGKIGEGNHIRYIVNSEEFMKKVQE
ncbi:dihydrolipoamide acyltransferase [Clostridium carboxidivorans P7]|uniref:Thioesterase superfamily protein n=1 Tax=Clostridium carboxidivorans P7 TaxID=536227 RepID=C6Q0E0_9CLOT|nr:thioesterase family protein [Clostridium carboxidivorans]AKN33020.1 dihydrolipoamide acyltransferase [Clostridium carboxidivorans P7]EET85040.1 thioesterase superfamily protein [Clostridium carboxidivorans P7]EFG88059.1 thioesterase family protein [Clostridium carboxidivorans P7]